MGKDRKVERERFYEAVEIIQRTFPSIHFDVQDEPPNVDAAIDIPQQPGLDFDVSINLQIDELHINAGAFWNEWFPCDDQYVFDQFVEAVTGILSGTFRIVEYYVAGSPVKAQLQKPQNSTWQTVAVWSHLLGILVPFRRTKRILQNSHAN